MATFDPSQGQATGQGSALADIIGPADNDDLGLRGEGLEVLNPQTLPEGFDVRTQQPPSSLEDLGLGGEGLEILNRPLGETPEGRQVQTNVARRKAGRLRDLLAAPSDNVDLKNVLGFDQKSVKMAEAMQSHLRDRTEVDEDLQDDLVIHAPVAERFSQALQNLYENGKLNIEQNFENIRNFIEEEGGELAEEFRTAIKSDKGIKDRASSFLAGILSSPEAPSIGLEKTIELDVPDVIPETSAELSKRFRDENPDLIDEFLETAGNSVSYYVPSVVGQIGGKVALRGVGVISSKIPLEQAARLSRITGASLMTSVEALAEGGDAYLAAIQMGYTEEEAELITQRVTTANIAILSFTNLGLQTNQKSILRRLLLTMPLEAIEEVLQTKITNRELGLPENEGVFKSFVFGGLLGLILGTATIPLNVVTDVDEHKRTLKDRILGEKNPPTPSDVINIAAQAEAKDGRIGLDKVRLTKPKEDRQSPERESREAKYTGPEDITPQEAREIGLEYVERQKAVDEQTEQDPETVEAESAAGAVMDLMSNPAARGIMSDVINDQFYQGKKRRGYNVIDEIDYEQVRASAVQARDIAPTPAALDAINKFLELSPDSVNNDIYTDFKDTAIQDKRSPKRKTLTNDEIADLLPSLIGSTTEEVGKGGLTGQDVIDTLTGERKPVPKAIKPVKTEQSILDNLLEEGISERERDNAQQVIDTFPQSMRDAISGTKPLNRTQLLSKRQDIKDAFPPGTVRDALLQNINEQLKSGESSARANQRKAAEARRQAANDRSRAEKAERKLVRQKEASVMQQDLLNRIRTKLKGHPQKQTLLMKRALKATSPADAVKINASITRALKQIAVDELGQTVQTVPGNVDVKYQKLISELMEGIDLKNASAKTMKKLRSRLQHIMKTTGDIVPKQLEAELIRLTKNPAIKMSTKDIKRLKQAIESLIRLGQTMKRMKESRNERDRQILLKEVVEGSTNIDNRLSNERLEDMTEQQIKESFHDGTANRSIKLMSKPRVMTRIDGGKFGGPNLMKLWKEKTYDPQQQFHDEFHGRTASYKLRLIKEVGSNATITLKSGKSISIYHPKSQEMIAKALAFDQKLFTQMKASGWKVERPKLTTMQEQIVMILRDSASERFTEFSAADALLNNNWTAKEDNYFRIAYQREVMLSEEEMFQRGIRKPSLAEQSRHSATAGLNASESSLKNRSPNVKKPLRTDIFTILDQTIAMQEFVINVDIPTRNLQAIVNTQEYQASAGEVAVDYWNRYMSNISRTVFDPVAPSSLGSLMNLNQNIAASYLAGAIRAAVVQPSQIVVAGANILAEAGPIQAAQSTLHMTVNFFKPSIVAKTSKETPVIRYRKTGESFADDIMAAAGGADAKGDSKEFVNFQFMIQELQDDRIKLFKFIAKWRNKTAASGFKHTIQASDVRSASSTFEEFHNMYKKTMPPDKAKHLAEIMTMQMNSDATVAFRPEAWDTVSNVKNPVARGMLKSFFLFKSFQVNMVNNIYYDLIYRRLVKGTKTVTPNGVEKGRLLSGLYATMAIGMIATGLWAFDELGKATTNFFKSTLPRLFGFEGKDPTEHNALFPGALIALATQVPILSDAIFIASNQYGTFGAPVTGAITKMFMDLGTVIKSKAHRGKTDLAIGLTQIFGGFGYTKDIFTFLKAAAKGPKKGGGKSGGKSGAKSTGKSGGK